MKKSTQSIVHDPHSRFSGNSELPENLKEKFPWYYVHSDMPIQPHTSV